MFLMCRWKRAQRTRREHERSKGSRGRRRVYGSKLDAIKGRMAPAILHSNSYLIYRIQNSPLRETWIPALNYLLESYVTDLLIWQFAALQANCDRRQQVRSLILLLIRRLIYVLWKHHKHGNKAALSAGSWVFEFRIITTSRHTIAEPSVECPDSGISIESAARDDGRACDSVRSVAQRARVGQLSRERRGWHAHRHRVRRGTRRRRTVRRDLCATHE